jgi:hypothetical protein
MAVVCISYSTSLGTIFLSLPIQGNGLWEFLLTLYNWVLRLEILPLDYLATGLKCVFLMYKYSCRNAYTDSHVFFI